MEQNDQVTQLNSKYKQAQHQVADDQYDLLDTDASQGKFVAKDWCQIDFFIYQVIAKCLKLDNEFLDLIVSYYCFKTALSLEPSIKITESVFQKSILR